MTSNLYFRNHAAGETYAAMLWAAWEADPRQYDPDYALGQDIWFYEKLRRDLRMMKLVRVLTTLVAGRRFTVTAEEDDNQSRAAAGLCEASLKKIGKFKESRKQLALASFKGETWGRIFGARLPLKCPDGFTRTLWVPTKLEDVDKRRFELRDDGQGRRVWAMQTLSEPYEWRALAHPEWYCRHVKDEAEDTLGRGRGMSEPLYFCWYAKQKLLKDGLQGAEKWSQGIVKAHIDGLRIGATDKTNADMVTQALNNLEKMRARNVLVTGSKDKNDVEALERSGQGHQIVMELIRYLDDSAEEFVLGGTHSQGGGDESGYNKGLFHRQTRDLIVQDEQEELSESITNSLVKLWWNVNKPILCSMGLREASLSRFHIVQDRQMDPLTATKLIADGRAAGLRIPRSFAHEVTGIPMPTEDEQDVLEPTQPVQQRADPFGGDIFGDESRFGRPRMPRPEREQ